MIPKSVQRSSERIMLKQARAGSGASWPMLAAAGRDRPLGRGDPGQVGAVRGGVVAARAGLAGKEQSIVHRRGERGAAVRLSRQGIGVGTAGERIDAPGMQPERPDAT